VLDPIIWLSADQWFTFVRRRIKEISNFQAKLCRFKTPAENYGVLTLILTHIIQHIRATPIVKDSLLREDLKALRFDAVCDRFGCFFLHQLDLTNGHLPDVREKDTPQMLKSMGVEPNARKEKARNKKLPPPCQGSMSWDRLGELLNQGDKGVKLREFEWDDLWYFYAPAIRLFCCFTFDYWSFQKDELFTRVKTVPRSLQEAMNLWSLPSIKERSISPTEIKLTPSADGLENNVPPRSRRQFFGEKRTTFFPEPGETPAEISHWIPLFTKGYVRGYHEAIENSEDNGKAIKDSLDAIFKNLQVLPHNPGRHTNNKLPWLWKLNEVHLLLNSTYILIEDKILRFAGGGAKGKRATGPNKCKTNGQMEKLLEKTYREEPSRTVRAIQKSTAVERKQLLNGRSGKYKNKRKPPVKKMQTAVGEEPVKDGRGGWARGSKPGEAEGGKGDEEGPSREFYEPVRGIRTVSSPSSKKRPKEAEESGMEAEESGLDAEESGLDAEESGLDAEESGLEAEESGLEAEDSGLDAEDSGSDAEDSGLDAEDSGLEADESELEADESELEEDESEVYDVEADTSN
jgi:hypothetical protein